MRVSDTFKPKPLKKLIPENKFLQTRDINYPPIDYGDSHRRQFRNTNFIGDIEGAKADTIRHGLVSKRSTNPLNPIYHALDQGEVLENPVESGIPPQLLLEPTFKPSKIESMTNLNRSLKGNGRAQSNNRDDSSDTLFLNLNAGNSYLAFGSHPVNNTSKGDAASRSLDRSSKLYESEIQSVRDLP